MTDITSYDDIIDVRDITDRVEELRDELTDVKGGESVQAADMDLAEWCKDAANQEGHPFADAVAELATLESLLDDIRGYGGDHQWEGAWYPLTLIRDEHFTEYAMELLADIGDIPRNMPHYIVIDEDATAKNIQSDYSDVEFDGSTYWYR
ncbi:hypothetical protein BGV52_15330 [Burkholderia ubonensis]|uniref:hypothetical protein n=1 Tax=Burkholderia ubonensis TaxID=101571 RepID=UPI000756AD88|nr:hypothetical protein [Burkholderia ubonensis]KVU68953.1 hypothetical protein WK72_14615 [Burkholderia ubonensis]KVW40335.1 hypothetical protein WK94_23550 [Burkholderia ubonensis]KWH15642.1 hypothetical protein WL97_16520 [Burkholderia ubonensis]OJB09058.1 hypothetical protein BGV52_15330 [Burkholderia ubonensis]